MQGLVLKCAYGGDGGTRASADGCRGGAFCSSPGDAWCNGEPHRPDDLVSVLVPRGEYNEVILDADSVERRLPTAVDAFFYMKGTPPGRAARVRELFLKENGRVRERDFPLVKIDVRNRQQPFSDG